MVHLVGFLKECFDGGERGQGFVRARVFSLLFDFPKHNAIESLIKDAGKRMDSLCVNIKLLCF